MASKAPPRRRSNAPDHTEPHFMDHTSATPTDPNGRSHDVNIMTEVHYDIYTDELGSGTPVYDAWVIEDDNTGADPDAKYENLGRAAEASAAGRGFRTPAGRPSSNELWRFRIRGCQDCWAAVFFFGFLFMVILWGASELHHFSLTPDMVAVIRVNLGLADISGSTAGQDDLVSLPPTNTGEAVAAAASASPASPPSKSRGGRNAKGRGDGGAERGVAAPSEVTIANVAFSGWTLRRTVWVLAWSAVCVVVACVGLTLFRWMPRFLIVLECWMEFALFASVGLVSCLSGNLFGAILFGVLAAFPLLWLYLVQDRIPFAVCLLKVVSCIVQRHLGLVLVSVCVAVVFVLYALLTTCFMVPPVLRAAAEVSGPADGGYVLTLLFALLWVEQVLVNVVHVTASGVAATWYFAGEAHMPDSPVRTSFWRATTRSIGSISFGSLFVAVVRFLHFIAQALRTNDSDDVSFLGCVCDCFLGILESLLKYFNDYAFVHVAVYGCSYIDAARRTWALTQKCFFAAAFNDCLVYQAVNALCIMLTLGTALAGGLVCRSTSIGLIIFFIAYFVNSIVFQLVQSTVTAIFVCFAEVPEGLELSFPELYKELTKLDSTTSISGVHDRDLRSYGTV